MKLTPALYVRQLLTKWHPPPPKTHRESQQFLNFLETSFHRHVDEAHPPPGQIKALDASQRDVPLAPTPSSRHTAQQFIKSILTHPLLDKPQDDRPWAKSHRRNAVERYQIAFAEGAVSLDLLASCTGEYNAGVQNGEQNTPGFMFGLHLASYLSLANSDTRAAFFLRSPLLSSALKVMFVDGEEAAVWTWLRMVYEREFGSHSESIHTLSDSRWLKTEDMLVSSLMRYSIRRRDLGDAAQQFVEACRYRINSGRAAAITDSSPADQSTAPLLSSWKRLAASIISARGRHSIPAPLFDVLLSYAPGWAYGAFLSDPFLSIYHPSTPSSQILCMTLRNSGSAELLVSEFQKATPTMTRQILVSVLDGAQVSLDQGLEQDVRFLLDFAATHFAEHLPRQTSTTPIALQDRIKVISHSLRSRSQHMHHDALNMT